VRILSLPKHGVAIDTVSTIAEARSSLRNDTYDLVLLAAREDPEEGNLVLRGIS
jgi:DNA-binding response OmpR family regulator